MNPQFLLVNAQTDANVAVKLPGRMLKNSLIEIGIWALAETLGLLKISNN